MGYLFGVSGRINRSKMWLFLIVSLAWLIVTGLAFMTGLHFFWGPECIEDCAGKTLPEYWGLYSFLAFVAGLLLLVTYLTSCLAVCAKRLHDRDKSAIWLVPFVLIPLGVAVVEAAGAVGLGTNAACVVGVILAIWGFVELLLFRGTVGPNRFGPDLLATEQVGPVQQGNVEMHELQS